MTSCARRTRTPEREGESAWSVLVLAEGVTPERERKDTHIAPVLPECARGTNQIWKLREVLPPRAQWERHAYPSNEAQQASLEGPFIWAVLVQGRSRTSMAIAPSRGDTSQFGRIII